MNALPSITKPAILYTITTGQEKTVNEVFIPSLEIIFNAEGSIFRATHSRQVQAVEIPTGAPRKENHGTLIQLNNDIIEKIDAFAKRNLHLVPKEVVKNLFKSVEMGLLEKKYAQ